MTIILRREYVLLLFDAIWGSFVVCSTLISPPALVLNTLGFISLICLPGVITILALRLTKLTTWGFITLMVGFSIVELMLSGLFLNATLPFLGILRPLDTTSLLPGLSVLFALLTTCAWVKARDIRLVFPEHLFSIDARAALFACTPLLFVAMSVFGAIRLNNGASNILTFLMLALLAIYCMFLLRRSKDLSENVTLTALYFISLALLLMTSLRGWFITGHDIQREFQVFQITKDSGIWNIASYKDAYNACMSITVLPTMISNLFVLESAYVYKTVFQLIFAFVPGIIYMSLRRYASAFVALLSVLYFIAFPTFFTDMPFLGRQEIAFLYLALMAYFIFDERLSLKLRRALFLVFGLGMVLSHYSTTYTILALLFFVVATRALLPFARRAISIFISLSDSGIAALRATDRRPPRITVLMVSLLAGASFFWSSVLTDTSSNSLYRVAIETLRVMQSNVREDARSSDVSYSLFSSQKMSDAELLRQYEKNVVAKTREEAPAGTFYDARIYAQYPARLAQPELLPPTAFGTLFSSAGFDIPAFNNTFRQWSAKILQLLIIAGTGALIYRRRFLDRPLDTEFALLALGSLIFVFSIVILPVLSVEYGLLRAFEQSLIFLGIFAAIGSLAVFSWMRENIRNYAASALVVVFLLSTTGFITQSLGGYDPQLHLNNAGSYYDYFYAHASEVAGIRWLSLELGKEQNPNFQMEALSGRTLSIPGHIGRQASALDDIYPGLIRKNSYVLLNATNVDKQESAVSYQGTNLTYRYPSDLLDDNKNLVYTNGQTYIYR